MDIAWLNIAELVEGVRRESSESITMGYAMQIKNMKEKKRPQRAKTACFFFLKCAAIEAKKKQISSTREKINQKKKEEEIWLRTRNPL